MWSTETYPRDPRKVESSQNWKTPEQGKCMVAAALSRKEKTQADETCYEYTIHSGLRLDFGSTDRSFQGLNAPAGMALRGFRKTLCATSWMVIIYFIDHTMYYDCETYIGGLDFFQQSRKSSAWKEEWGIKVSNGLSHRSCPKQHNMSIISTVMARFTYTLMGQLLQEQLGTRTRHGVQLTHPQTAVRWSSVLFRRGGYASSLLVLWILVAVGILSTFDDVFL
ncbi:hypothetical protein Tco_1399168 [Tanacetum coccineum]